MWSSLYDQHLKLIRRNIQDASRLVHIVKSHQERNIFRRRRTKRTRPQSVGSTLGSKRPLLSIALQPNRQLINLTSPLSQLQDSLTPPYKIKNQCHTNVYLLGHLRAPCLPRRNPSIPVPANRQKNCNVSMIICDVIMGYFYGRGVSGLPIFSREALTPRPQSQYGLHSYRENCSLRSGSNVRS